VSADRKATPEVHGKKDLSKHLPFWDPPAMVLAIVIMLPNADSLLPNAARSAKAILVRSRAFVREVGRSADVKWSMSDTGGFAMR